MISKDDVIEVIETLGFKSYKFDIDEILKSYPSEQEMDPSGSWDLVIEKMIYDRLKC